MDLESNITCNVCLDCNENLIKCDHCTWHMCNDCIEKYIQSSNFCPHCKSKIPEEYIRRYVSKRNTQTQTNIDTQTNNNLQFRPPLCLYCLWFLVGIGVFITIILVAFGYCDVFSNCNSLPHNNNSTKIT